MGPSRNIANRSLETRRVETEHTSDSRKHFDLLKCMASALSALNNEAQDNADNISRPYSNIADKLLSLIAKTDKEAASAIITFVELNYQCANDDIKLIAGLTALSLIEELPKTASNQKGSIAHSVLRSFNSLHKKCQNTDKKLIAKVFDWNLTAEMFFGPVSNRLRKFICVNLRAVKSSNDKTPFVAFDYKSIFDNLAVEQAQTDNTAICSIPEILPVSELPISRLDVNKLRHEKNSTSLGVNGASYVLSNGEKRRTFDAAKSTLKKRDDDCDPALYVLLMMSLSRKFNYLLGLKITWVPDYTNGIEYVDLTLGVFVRKDLPLESAAKVDNQLTIMDEHQTFLNLPLDVEIVNFLRDLADGFQTFTLGDRLPLTDDSLKKFKSDLMAKISYTRAILTDKAIRYSIYHSLLSTNDSAACSLILSTDEFASVVPLYYRSICTSTAIASYMEAMSQMGAAFTGNQTGKVGCVIGSQLAININKFADQVISRLKSKLTNYGDITSDESLFEFHNLYTLYTAMMLHFCLRLRSKKKFIINSDNYNAKSRCILVSDKVSSLSGGIRLLKIPEITAKQIAEYKQHLRFACIVGKCSRLKTLLKTQYDISSFELFFLRKAIDEESIETTDASSHNICQMIEMYFDLTIRPNFMRHIAGAFLHNDAFGLTMGHNNANKNVYNTHNIDPHSDLLKIESEVMNQLNILGFVFIEARKVKGRLVETHSTIDTATSEVPLLKFKVYEQAVQKLRKHFGNVSTIVKYSDSELMLLQEILIEQSRECEDPDVAKKMCSIVKSLCLSLLNTKNKGLRKRQLRQFFYKSDLRPDILVNKSMFSDLKQQHFRLARVLKAKDSDIDSAVILIFLLAFEQTISAKRLARAMDNNKTLICKFQVNNGVVTADLISDNEEVVETIAINHFIATAALKYCCGQKAFSTVTLEHHKILDRIKLIVKLHYKTSTFTRIVEKAKTLKSFLGAVGEDPLTQIPLLQKHFAVTKLSNVYSGDDIARLLLPPKRPLVLDAHPVQPNYIKHQDHVNTEINALGLDIVDSQNDLAL